MTSDASVTKPDFPDWISPMLVKELRQGLRSRVFVFCLLAIQAAMAFLALMGLLKASVHDDTSSITAFFWIIAGVPMLLIMPFSGLGAISREKTANTLELIFLTRLTSRRIVFGKWVAIIAQTLLLVSAILPYAVMRYYIGGINITTELTVLAWMLGGSALLSAIMVGISPYMGRVLRIVMPIAIFILLYICLGLLFDSPMGGVWRVDWPLGVILMLQAVLLMLLMLEVGAGKIGPDAENHSTPKRLIAAASVVLTVVQSYLPRGTESPVWWPVLFIALPVMIGAICEPIREVPSVYRPFTRLGFPGRLLGRLFYPGWPSGIVFALALIVIAGIRVDELATGMHVMTRVGWHVRSMRGASAASATQHPRSDWVLVRIMEVAWLGAFFLPVAFFRLIRPKVPVPTVLYFVSQGLLGLLSLMGILVTEYGGAHPYQSFPSLIEQWVACIPTCTIFLRGRIEYWQPAQQRFVFFGVSIVTAATLVVLFIKRWPAWRTVAALEKTAAALEPPASNPPDAVRPSSAA
jgi:hypothetical protein